MLSYSHQCDSLYVTMLLQYFFDGSDDDENGSHQIKSIEGYPWLGEGGNLNEGSFRFNGLTCKTIDDSHHRGYFSS